jgi:hypothetical protein
MMLAEGSMLSFCFVCLLVWKRCNMAKGPKTTTATVLMCSDRLAHRGSWCAWHPPTVLLNGDAWATSLRGALHKSHHLLPHPGAQQVQRPQLRQAGQQAFHAKARDPWAVLKAAARRGTAKTCAYEQEQWHAHVHPENRCLATSSELHVASCPPAGSSSRT